MRRVATFAACSLFAVPAFTPASALDVPQRKPGLWELKTEFQGGHLPAHYEAMYQCGQ